MNKEELDEYPDYEALDIEAINSILDEDERQGMLEYISQLEQENTDLKQKISSIQEHCENKLTRLALQMINTVKQPNDYRNDGKYEAYQDIARTLEKEMKV
jgi:hypothetical protein